MQKLSIIFLLFFSWFGLANTNTNTNTFSISPITSSNKNSSLMQFEGKNYYISNTSIIDDIDVLDIKIMPDYNNKFVLNFTISNDGAKRLKNWTSNNLGKNLPIIINNKIISMPVVYGVIDKYLQLSLPNFTVEELRILKQKILPNQKFYKSILESVAIDIAYLLLLIKILL